MNIIKNETYDVNIESMTNEGNGVCKIDGYTVFVPNTAIGDNAKILIVKANKSFGYGKLLELYTPSKTRCENDCMAFPKCGGCDYRHIEYDSEADIKFQIVKDAFERLGGINTEFKPIIKSKMPYEYRNKAQYPVTADENGRCVSGFFAKRSHRIVFSDLCKIVPKEFEDIKNSIIVLLNKYNVKPYVENTHTGVVRNIYIRKGFLTNEIMLCLVSTTDKINNINDITKEIVLEYPNIKSIIVNVNKDNTNVILGKKCVTVYGSETIKDILCGVTIEISPLSFYQVNHNQAEKLYNKAIEYADFQGNEIVVDMYCGAGTIGLSLANKVKQVVGIEIIKEAVENAKNNAEINNIKNAEFICADALNGANELIKKGLKPDVVIVDPPRKGIGQDVVDAIGVLNPKKVIMVSCNPATAARDCALLKEIGYITQEVTPVDMFPRTTHVETIIMMTYCGDKPKK